MKPLTITPPKGEKVKQITRNDDGTVTIEFEVESYKFEDLPNIYLDDDTAERINALIQLLKLSQYFGGGKWYPYEFSGGISATDYFDSFPIFPTFPTKEIAIKVYEQNKELFRKWRS